MSTLSRNRRTELRAQAHNLTPVVIIGDKGLTDEVIAEIDRSLRAHELIKVRASGGERDVRRTWLETICERLQAHAVQQIGKVFVIYRENPQEKPAAAAAPGGGPGRRETTATAKARVVSERAREKQRAKDMTKRRQRDAMDMARKGKFGPGNAGTQQQDGDTRPRSGARGDERTTGAPEGEVTRTSRPRSRTPSPLPASGPRRRRPRTSR